MKKRILRYLKHILLTIIVLMSIAVVVGLSIGAAVHYGDHPLQYSMINEGPYIFYKNDSTLNINYINGSRKEGYTLTQKTIISKTLNKATCYFPLDSTSFDFIVNDNFNTPPVAYNDGNPILAISDIESGYKAFRDFLINNNVIDKRLNWIFGKGHLVLVGDFVDRGNSTTQVLWFIYKLEQEAKKKGGQVHYIIGNHELKNFQGNYKSASDKYFRIASVLEKPQLELFSPNSLLGKWMSSKNTVELINENLFTHGGLHPDLSNKKLSLDEINRIIRSNYYKIFYPKPVEDLQQQLVSTLKGPCWYRGYYKENLTQEQIDKSMAVFGAKAIVVGHTIQSKVNRQYNGKVIGIDVKHPNDYHKNWPNPESEGLLITEGKYFRVLANGEKIEL